MAGPHPTVNVTSTPPWYETATVRWVAGLVGAGLIGFAGHAQVSAQPVPVPPPVVNPPVQPQAVIEDRVETLRATVERIDGKLDRVGSDVTDLKVSVGRLQAQSIGDRVVPATGTTLTRGR